MNFCGLSHRVCGSLPQGFPGGGSDKVPACQCRRHKRHRFDPWVRKIPWRRAWQPTSVFMPGESLGQRSLATRVHRVTQSQTQLKQLSKNTQSVEVKPMTTYSTKILSPWILTNKTPIIVLKVSTEK